MMKRVCVIMLVLSLFLVVTSSAYAHRGGSRGRVGVNVWLGPSWGPWGWWPYSAYSPHYPYYRGPSVVIKEEPVEYIQKTPQTEEPSYWYFCKDPEGYYPYIKRCPNGWLKVEPLLTPSN